MYFPCAPLVHSFTVASADFVAGPAVGQDEAVQEGIGQGSAAAANGRESSSHRPGIAPIPNLYPNFPDEPEYSDVTTELRVRMFPQAQPSGALVWIAAKSVRVEPMPLPGELSRDPDDNVTTKKLVVIR